jgi:hypothetical protein
MTLQDIAKGFEADYKLGVMRRGIKEINFGVALVYRMLTKGQAEVQRKLMATETYYDITLVPNTAEYDLPSDFGVHKLVKSSVSSSVIYLKEASIDNLNAMTINTTTETGESYYYAIYAASGTSKIKLFPVPSLAGTLTVSYYKKLLNYAASDTIDLTQTFTMPDEYAEAVILFMLNEVFSDDMSYARYREKMDSLKGSRNVSIDQGLTYDMARLDT